MIPLLLDVQRLHGLFLCGTFFLGSDDEDARKSSVGRRELSQVILKEVNRKYELDILTLAVTVISQTLEHICVISLFLLCVSEF